MGDICLPIWGCARDSFGVSPNSGTLTMITFDYSIKTQALITMLLTEQVLEHYKMCVMNQGLASSPGTKREISTATYAAPPPIREWAALYAFKSPRVAFDGCLIAFGWLKEVNMSTNSS